MTNTQAHKKPVILVTRPEESGRRFSQQIKHQLGDDVDVLVSPVLEIETYSTLPDLTKSKTLIFTSVHAVRGFTKLTKRREFACYVVGSSTAKVAKDAGFDAIDGGGQATALVEKIKMDAPPTPYLYLRGEHVSSDVAGSLNAEGMQTEQATLYSQVTVPLSEKAMKLLRKKRPVLLPLFSARSAQLFFEQGIGRAPLHVVAMSEAVAEKVPRAKVKSIRIASKPDIEAMLSGLQALWSAANQLEGGDPAQ